MKLSIYDLADDCFPEQVTLGEQDAAMIARIQERVRKEIRMDAKRQRHHTSRTIRIVALVAAVAAALSATAYASGLFKMHMNAPGDGEVVSGTWSERNEDGSIADVQTWTYPDAGFVFTFEAETTPHVVKFKPGWLPEPSGGPIFGMPDEEGWYGYLSDNGEGKNIPYVIQVMYMNEGMTLVLNGACQIVKEGNFRGYEMRQIHCRYMPEYLNDGNYLLLIDENEGYCLIVSGTNSMEDMEHIAQELEIRVCEELLDYNQDCSVGQINIGRG